MVAFEGYSAHDGGRGEQFGNGEVEVYEGFRTSHSGDPSSWRESGTADTTGITATATSALDHVAEYAEPAGVGYPETADHTTGTEQTALADSSTPNPAAREEHHPMVSRSDFRHLVTDLTGGDVNATHATRIFQELIRGTIRQDPEIIALPESERPAYFVETYGAPTGEWVVSLPNAQLHAGVIMRSRRLHGEKTDAILREVLHGGGGQEVPEDEPNETQQTPETGAQGKRPHRTDNEFVRALPTLEEVRQSNGPIITRKDFAALAGTPSHVAGRVFNRLTAVLYRTDDGSERGVPLDTMEENIRQASHRSGSMTAEALTSIAQRVLVAAREREALQAAEYRHSENEKGQDREIA